MSQQGVVLGGRGRWWPFRAARRRLAVVRLEGVIGTGSTLTRRRLSMRAMESRLVRAFALPRAEAVVLLVNSPGGSPVQSARLCNRIRELAKYNHRPVIAFIDDVAASGGYWLACAGDEIYANPSSIVGSIGVISAGFGFVGLMEKLGLERRLHVSGNRKALLDPFSPEDPDDVAHLRSIQTQVHQEFIDAVRERRGKRLSGSDEELFSGAFWTGRQALERGLVDGVGDVTTILLEKFGRGIRLVEISDRVPWWRRWFFWRSPASGMAGSVEGMAGGVADSLIARLEERAWWSRFGL